MGWSLRRMSQWCQAEGIFSATTPLFMAAADAKCAECVVNGTKVSVTAEPGLDVDVALECQQFK